MKTVTICLFILITYSCNLKGNLCCDNHISSTSVKFIVIANVGASNYSIAPLVISTENINYIEYNKAIYGLNLKFRGYNNVVLNNEDFEMFFNYINSFKSARTRHDDFVKGEEGYKLIIDYRDNNNNDFELLSVKSLTSVFFTLRNIYIYIEHNNLNKDLLAYIEALYAFYINTYDIDNKTYKKNIVNGL